MLDTAASRQTVSDTICPSGSSNHLLPVPYSLFMHRSLLPLALLLALAACRSEQETSTGRLRMEQVPAAVKGEMSTTETVGETGRSHGYIRRFYQEQGRYFITVDYVQFLNGEAAVAAARRRNDAQVEVQNGDTLFSVFDDYYIINDDPRQRTLPLSEQATLTLWDRTPGIPLSQYQTTTAEALSKGAALFEHAPFVVVTQQGVVVSLTEQYIP